MAVDVRSLSHKWLSENELRRRPDKPFNGARRSSSHGRLFHTNRSSELSGLSPAQVLLGPTVFKFDGGSDHSLRGILRKPAIPPRASSRYALIRSHSSESSNPLVTIRETSERRASSLSGSSRQLIEIPAPDPANTLPEHDTGAIDTIPPHIPACSPDINITLNLNTQGRAINNLTPKNLTPLANTNVAPHVAPQISIQPTLATPILIIRKNESPFDTTKTLENGRVRRVSTSSVGPFADTESSLFRSGWAERQTDTGAGSAESSVDGKGPLATKRPSRHVGWKSGLLEVAHEQDGDPGLPENWGTRRRSSSLPELTSGGKELKSVKSRRATPWVHNLEQGAIFSRYNSKGQKRPFPTLKTLSVSSVGSVGSVNTVDSGFEVWFDAVEEQSV